jgi:succinate dehydrogenase / fumarate reductase iron-sulfur subunit
MTNTMTECGFGNCTNHYECMAACPKGINVKFIARMNREFIKSLAVL